MTNRYLWNSAAIITFVILVIIIIILFFCNFTSTYNLGIKLETIIILLVLLFVLAVIIALCGVDGRRKISWRFFEGIGIFIIILLMCVSLVLMAAHITDDFVDVLAQYAMMLFFLTIFIAIILLFAFIIVKIICP